MPYSLFGIKKDKKLFEMSCHLAPFSISEVHSSHSPLRLVVKFELSPTTSKVRSTCVGRGNNKNLAVVTIANLWLIIEVARQKGRQLCCVCVRSDMNCISFTMRKYMQCTFENRPIGIYSKRTLTFKKPLKNHSRTSPSWLILKWSRMLRILNILWIFTLFCFSHSHPHLSLIHISEPTRPY